MSFNQRRSSGSGPYGARETDIGSISRFNKAACGLQPVWTWLRADGATGEAWCKVGWKEPCIRSCGRLQTYRTATFSVSLLGSAFFLFLAASWTAGLICRPLLILPSASRGEGRSRWFRPEEMGDNVGIRGARILLRWSSRMLLPRCLVFISTLFIWQRFLIWLLLGRLSECFSYTFSPLLLSAVLIVAPACLFPLQHISELITSPIPSSSPLPPSPWALYLCLRWAGGAVFRLPAKLMSKCHLHATKTQISYASSPRLSFPVPLLPPNTTTTTFCLPSKFV